MMQLRTKVFTLSLLLVLMISAATAQQETTTGGAAQPQAATPQTPAPTAPEPAQAPTAPAPAQAPTAGTAGQPSAESQAVPQQSAMPEESVPLRVMVGKSLLINTTDRLKRVSVTDPNVADAVVVTPHQVMVHGRAPGEVSLVIWDEQERSRSFDLRVDVDITAAAEEVKRIFPQEQISVTASRSAIVLSGHVGTQDVADRAGKIAEAFSKNVVNVLTAGPEGAQEVMLEVKFAEVDRTALLQYGVNIFSTGAANTFGAISTQQFSPLTGNVGSFTTDVTPGSTPSGTSVATGEIGRGNFHNPGSFGTNDLLNLFVFRSDINLGAFIKLLQQKNVLQILAEPNLIAVNGKEASFLAGGEFPIPVVQGAAGLNSVTILFKEFGVRLSFTPVITPNGNIHLTVKPEVSALDFANGLRLSGFTVPALTTRRASTEFEIQDGQSFVIAGLMDNRVTRDLSKMPGLADIPILGYLFKSKNLQQSKTELMVLVTAHRVAPTDTPPALLKGPEKYLDDKKFDSNKPGGASGK